jgi:predicted nucleic acid-binding Zn ribbon protein
MPRLRLTSMNRRFVNKAIGECDKSEKTSCSNQLSYRRTDSRRAGLEPATRPGRHPTNRKIDAARAADDSEAIAL